MGRRGDLVPGVPLLASAALSFCLPAGLTHLRTSPQQPAEGRGRPRPCHQPSFSRSSLLGPLLQAPGPPLRPGLSAPAHRGCIPIPALSLILLILPPEYAPFTCSLPAPPPALPGAPPPLLSYSLLGSLLSMCLWEHLITSCLHFYYAG